MLDPKSRCVHCGVLLFTGGKKTNLPPDLEANFNILNERIASCECRSCGKISPLAFKI